MAADTDTKQNDTKPAGAAKAAPKRKPAGARTSRSEPTATATTATGTPRPQAKALNGGQQLVAGVIDAQEKTVEAIVDYQTRAAALSQIPGATAVVEAQAQVLRSVTGAYVSAARAFLK